MMRPEQLPGDTRVLARRNMRVLRPFARGFDSEVEVVVGVALCNQAASLRRCLESILAQETGGMRVGIVILDDGSEDDWRSEANELLERPHVVLLEANCGSAARARNAILDYVDGALPRARWVARLDADDRFATSRSLATAVAAGERDRVRFVLGGNGLILDGVPSGVTNRASADLMDRRCLLDRLRSMADGTAETELPSCNLLLATHTGWRYPDLESAEDHWLVADLLINHPDQGVILTEPLYCDYSLKGGRSRANTHAGRYRTARESLCAAAENWVTSAGLPGIVLGYGGEGVVRLVDGMVEKRFHRGKLSDEAVVRLDTLLRDVAPLCPEPVWSRDGDQWCCRYPYEATEGFEGVGVDEVREFLLLCLRKRIMFLNVKRDNFRRRSDGSLLFIDISDFMVPMDVRYFVDASARLYAIGPLEWADDELRRRQRGAPAEQTLLEIPGFADFYRDLLQEYAGRQWHGVRPCKIRDQHERADEVTLMVKACAMDAAMLVEQVRAIVGQLETPRRFHERVLAIDSHRGPFLRAHDAGDFDRLLREAERLRELGLIDRVVVSPDSQAEIRSVNWRWFGLDCTATHSAKGVPVAPQLWAFERIRTRYVLQCDVDVLIGRRDLSHDFLRDMLEAAEADDALGVAFNIPHDPSTPARPYDAPPGEFVPEVRCGLLDLDRIKACCPLPNDVINGRLALSWYRSLQKHQRHHGWRTLRGGDTRTFYIHPSNVWKRDVEGLARVRDLVSQGRVPAWQNERWDLEGTASDWTYPPRSEEIVFLIKGRNIPMRRVERCVASLMVQEDQRFGAIMIDDASDGPDVARLPHLLGPLRDRTTLIRNRTRRGRIPNIITAIREVCTNPETLVVLLDMDDALISRAAVSRLRAEYEAGADVVLAAMFRPDKPTKVYRPDFADPRANRSGGDVWIHLRSFRKRLFDALDDDALRIDGRWIGECTDYAIMIPVVEMARQPVYLPEYLYFHERTTPRTRERRRAKDAIIDQILMKPKAK